MNDSPSRSWFSVWNNPEWFNIYKTNADGSILYDSHGQPIIDHKDPSPLNGMTPEEICDYVNKTWCDVSSTRTSACAYCISADGLHHLHFVSEDSAKCRFSQVKQCFPSAHIEPTRGNKQQAENYINKRGSFAEKGEIIVCIKYLGDIQGTQGKRSDLDEIEQLINDGYTPDEICKKGIRYLSKEKLIRNAFYKKRMQETPILRQVDVFYHYGTSGTGKSYFYTTLCESIGENEVYFCGQYDNGWLDEYNGQKVLFMDEFRGQIRFATLLSITQGYRQYYHARNHNILGLWSQVHITSVLPPELLYQKALSDDKHDLIEQFLRRLTGIYYHWKDRKTGEYRFKFIPKENYSGFKDCFTHDDSEFMQLTLKDLTDLPF